MKRSFPQALSDSLRTSTLTPRPKSRRRIKEHHIRKIEAGLRAGVSMRQIAKRLKFSHKTIQEASRGIRKSLAESGVTCGCGLPLGHPRLCTVTAKSTRTVREGEITPRHRRHMEERFLAGQSAHEIGGAMGFTHVNVLAATKDFRARMFEQGVACGCGKALGHPYACKFNLRRRKTWRGGGLTAIGKRRVRIALLEGHHLPDIVRDLDVAELSVLQMRKALTPDERQQRKRAMRDREAKPAQVIRTYEVPEAEYRALIDHVTPYLRDRADRYAKRLETRSKDDLLHDGILTLWSTRHTFKRDFDDRPIEERFRVWANRILYLVFVKAYWADGGGRMRQAPELRSQRGDDDRRDFLADMIVDTTSAAILDEIDLGAGDT
ncbi:helix-turn-helix domain-containing protein [Novosphingobium soli]|uniref:helix-turn-helix domain-containing protein n=1 Tax=Novosphingobium soli TaxID=574956 RepID=UPI0036271A7D